MTATNVLVTCGGTAVGMVLQLKQALGEVPALRGGGVFVADCAAIPPAAYFADATFVVPAIEHPGYVDDLLDVCRRHAVRVVLPLIDPDLDRLAPHLRRFADEGTTVVCPAPALVELCLDKCRFEAFARGEGLAYPTTHAAHALAPGMFPLFAKRRRGFGSVGAGICCSLAEAQARLARYPDLVFQEVIDAEELSVDAYVSAHGRCTVRVPRVRDLVVGGEAKRSHTVRSGPVAGLADRTIEALARHGLRGPLTVQIFGGACPTLIEVNTRVGSGCVLSNVATDGRLFRSILHEACSEVSTGDPDDYHGGFHLSRYFGDVIHDGTGLVASFPAP
ncbi:MAG TPA: ATP-grasp domain-containing protein [Methylomirabilota bacterium]|jgi:carbamoyl-phosphate synthase large subunit